MNLIIIIGNVGEAPEIKSVNNTKVANFSVATTERWKDKDGNKKEETTWHKVVAWDGLANLAEQYIGKGKQVSIEGKMRYRKYTDDENVTRTVAEVVADNIELLGKAEKQDDMPAA